MPFKAKKTFLEERRKTKKKNNNKVVPRSTSKVLLALKNYARSVNFSQHKWPKATRAEKVDQPGIILNSPTRARRAQVGEF